MEGIFHFINLKNCIILIKKVKKIECLIFISTLFLVKLSNVFVSISHSAHQHDIRKSPCSLFQSLFLSARRSGYIFPNFCARSDPCTRWLGLPNTKSSKLKNIFYIKEGFHFSGGRGVNQNFRKIFSIKGGRRGVLLLLTVTCSVIPDILSSTSFKLQTSPSSSASLRLLLMNLTNNRWIIISYVWYWPEREREKSSLTCG